MPLQHWHQLMPRAWCEAWKTLHQQLRCPLSLCWLATPATAQINSPNDPHGWINAFICKAMFNFVNCVTFTRVQNILNLPWWRSVPRTALETTLGQARRMRITDQYKDNSTGPKDVNAQDVQQKPQVHRRAWGFFIMIRTFFVMTHRTLFLSSPCIMGAAIAIQSKIYKQQVM